MMGTYTIFFIGFFAGTAGGAGLVYWTARDYLDRLIDERTTIAIDSVHKERDVILKKALDSAEEVQKEIDNAKSILSKLGKK